MASKNYVFYKICSEDCDETYVGSTANFKSRKMAHKSRCYNENGDKYNLKIYQAIRANGGWDNFKMIQIGTRDNITKREAEQVEEEYRLDLKATMNTQRAYRSPEVNKEHRKKYQVEYDKNYRQNNYEKIAERQKNWCEKNKEKIAEKKKKYSENNKEHIKEQKKEYYENKKEKIKEKHREVIDCECGLTYTYAHKSRHLKSKKHCEYIK